MMNDILVRPETGIDEIADAVARLASLRPDEVGRFSGLADFEGPAPIALVEAMGIQEGLLHLWVTVEGYACKSSEDVRLAADLSKFLDAPVYAWIKPDGWNDALAEFVHGTQTRVIDVEDEDD